MGKKSKNSKGSAAKGPEARIAQIKLSAGLTIAASLRSDLEKAEEVEKATNKAVSVRISDPVNKRIADLAVKAEKLIKNLEAMIEARDHETSLCGAIPELDLD